MHAVDELYEWRVDAGAGGGARASSSRDARPLAAFCLLGSIFPSMRRDFGLPNHVSPVWSILLYEDEPTRGRH